MKTIMFQGTASSVGKSTIAAGVCRILYQDGKRVAPFKSQNMSNHSYRLSDGRELSIAQWLQAKACGLSPDWRMNPILLKPVAEAGSEVILAGESLGKMSARDYYRQKPAFLDIIRRSLDELARRADLIVIEGAGSAAEINFRPGDFVNMGLAQLVQAPVILIGDIDRGGVFASLYGTIQLLDEADRSLIKGFIINKFRGDFSLLKETVDQFSDKLGLPCLGIVPFFPHNLPEEDSLIEAKTDTGRSVDQSLDQLARHLREHLDIAQLKRIAGL